MKNISRLIFLGIIISFAFKYTCKGSNHRISEISGNPIGLSRPPERTSTIEPPPEESTSIRRRSRRTSNYIQIAIAIYPSGSNRRVSTSCDFSYSESHACGFSDHGKPEYEIDHSNKVFAWAKEATRIYSPDSWHLLMQYEALPEVSRNRLVCGRIMEISKPAETFQYLSGSNVFDVISAMSSNIHEISHGYSRKNIIRHATENNIPLDIMRDEGRFIYLDPSESYLVTFPRELLFPASRMARSIPSDRRTRRYRTYITGNTSTQAHGVLALLDELNAYYLGSRYRYEMLQAYKVAGRTECEGFFEWVSDAQGSMGAFFEIDYFILEYLLYMKENHPENYELLRSNKSFREAWWAVRYAYNSLLADYFQKIKNQVRSYNDQEEFEFKIEDRRLRISRTGSRSSSSRLIISNAMDQLLPVLRSNRFVGIEQDFGVSSTVADLYSSY